MQYLRSLIGLGPSGWMMAPSERLAILDLLVTLKPKYTLEMGCADGGSECCPVLAKKQGSVG